MPPSKPLAAVRSVQVCPPERLFKKDRFTMLVPAREAAPPKFNRSDTEVERSTSKESAAELREIPELPSVIVRVASSTKLKVDALVAFRLVRPVESALAPLKSRVPPPVERMAPVLVLLPERVAVTPAPEVWTILPAPLMLLVIVVEAELASCRAAPLEMETLPLPAEPAAPLKKSVPVLMVVPPE